MLMMPKEREAITPTTLDDDKMHFNERVKFAIIKYIFHTLWCTLVSQVSNPPKYGIKQVRSFVMTPAGRT